MKILLISACFVLTFGASACKHMYAGTASQVGTVLGAEVNPLPQNVQMEVLVDSTARPARVYLTIRNGNKASVWFPKEEPDFKMNEQARVVECWFGYFENAPASQSRSDYCLPVMQEIMPGKELTIELTWPELVQAIAGGQLKCVSRVRFSVVNFPFVRIRGDKRLAEYLEKSIVVESSAMRTK